MNRFGRYKGMVLARAWFDDGNGRTLLYLYLGHICFDEQ